MKYVIGFLSSFVIIGIVGYIVFINSDISVTAADTAEITTKCAESLEEFQVEEINKNIFDSVISSSNHTLVFSFWATWCAPCKRELPYLIDFCKSKNIKLYLISNDLSNEKTIKRVKEVLCRNELEHTFIIPNSDGLSITNRKNEAILNFTKSIGSKFSETPGYPYMIVVENGKIQNEFRGLSERDVFNSFFEENILNRKTD